MLLSHHCNTLPLASCMLSRSYLYEATALPILVREPHRWAYHVPERLHKT